jgi:hypothetical protein
VKDSGQADYAGCVGVRCCGVSVQPKGESLKSKISLAIILQVLRMVLVGSKGLLRIIRIALKLPVRPSYFG